MMAIDLAEEIVKRSERLRQQLAWAAQGFEKSAPDGGRSSVHMTLHAFDDFLRAMFATREPSVFIPLHQLQYALHDLDHGKVIPLLAPQKVSRRPRDPTAKDALMALAAASMELFIKGGVVGRTQPGR
jgi:hypothetical protein